MAQGGTVSLSALLLLVSTSVACGDDDSDGDVKTGVDAGDSGAGLDAGGDAGNHPDASLDSGVLCVADSTKPFAACLDGVLTEIPSLCVYGAYQPPAAALGKVCLVSPTGTLYIATLRDDQLVATPGWTTDGYPGIRQSTLSAGDEVRCAQAKAATHSADAGASASCVH